MLAAHARIQAESASSINTDLWWETINIVLFSEIDKLSKSSKCELIITEKSNLNIGNWINNSHFYFDKFFREMNKLGYKIETTVFHDIIFEIKIKW